MISATVINSIVAWMQDIDINCFGYSFSLWEVMIADVFLFAGGTTIGYFLRPKD